MKSKVVTFRTIIEKDGKYYHGYVPTLPGCHTQGKTIEETRINLRDAIAGYIASLKKHNEPIPRDQGLESVETFELSELFPAKQRPYSYA